jgi:uncharacterized membrane protein YuzA (DUF378 family)
MAWNEEAPARLGNGSQYRKIFSSMSTLNVIALLLVIVGGVNWGLVGAADVDLVAAIFGPGTTLARAVYIIVGLSALYALTLIPKVNRRY